ncbi:MAG: glycogen/starch/alpha-glucan phosphorylase, partial [Pseudomonadales bacterium]
LERWKATEKNYRNSDTKRVYYLSLEFLMGRTLANAVQNLELEEPVSELLHHYGCATEDIAAQEHDAGLGNGGLGRLAACFLDSCASLQLPVMGYGIRYEYGMFHQRIEDGHQVECPDHWLRDGNPWELERAEDTRRIKFYGHTEYDAGENGAARWITTHDVLAVPYDTPVPGYRNGTVNTLRLWKAAATDEFDLDEFNAGSYPESVEAKNSAEHITMVLYPNDASENGKELRLRQQYFLASASLQDVLSRWVRDHSQDFSEFADKNCFQLNDTHPSCSVAELMRLLMDEHQLSWDEAWNITRQTMAYTNHTLLPEALERWPVRMFSHMLPRLMDIIYRINEQLLLDVTERWPEDNERRRDMSLIEEGDDPHIRMAFLAIVGSFSVNGVAALHTRLLQAHLFRNYYELWPEKFNNKTNGVTQRRWLAHSNPGLRQLISDTIGDGWQTNLQRLELLRPYADDAAFRQRWRGVKLTNKRKLATFIEREAGIMCDPTALFDVQVKRFHEYKRQLLNVLHVIHLYDRIRRGETNTIVPRVVLLGGKAAPGYVLAKLIIKLVNNVAQVVNEDGAVNGVLKLIFLPDYRVTAMEVICPGAELSEQISTAGKEASGTGNMKFMLNGALTIGTLDGANIEIREQAGEENFFLFGLDTAMVAKTLEDYSPGAIIEDDDDLMRVMALLEDGHFSADEQGIFNPIIDAIRNPHDQWVVAADFRSYVDAQQRVAEAYRDEEHWTRMSILNTAASGWFSSDRTISQYAEEIWGVPVKVNT